LRQPDPDRAEITQESIKQKNVWQKNMGQSVQRLIDELDIFLPDIFLLSSSLKSEISDRCSESH
jgi:hypothetical protein